MEKPKSVIVRKGELWIGLLEGYPDYRVQATNRDELEKKIEEIYQGLQSGRLDRQLD